MSLFPRTSTRSRASAPICKKAGLIVHVRHRRDIRSSERRTDRGADIAVMVRALSHRGPDRRGSIWIGSVGLGHARLSVIDLEGGGQPIPNEDETVWIVLNGEIYNFPELKPVWRARAIGSPRARTPKSSFISTRTRTSCVDDLNGQFAVRDLGPQGQIPFPGKGSPRNLSLVLRRASRPGPVRLRDQGHLRLEPRSHRRPWIRGPSTRCSPSGRPFRGIPRSTASASFRPDILFASPPRAGRFANTGIFPIAPPKTIRPIIPGPSARRSWHSSRTRRGSAFAPTCRSGPISAEDWIRPGSRP